VTGFVDVNKIKVAQHGCQWWAVVNMVINVRGSDTERERESEREMYAVLACLFERKKEPAAWCLLVLRR